jgi:serine phosphatase RsbU (regulator of sigma subunit)
MRAAPLEVSGLPLGTFDGVSYDEASVALAKGDVVVFYTDGLVEARREREEYGPERLLLGLEAHAGLAAAELGERLLSDLEGFLGVGLRRRD